LKLVVSSQSQQANKKKQYTTHVHSVFLLVWGSLTLGPITSLCTNWPQHWKLDCECWPNCTTARIKLLCNAACCMPFFFHRRTNVTRKISCYPGNGWTSEQGELN